MSDTLTWDILRKRLFALPAGHGMEVESRVMLDAFDEIGKYDQKTALGITLNEALILTNHRPVDPPAIQLQRFCREQGIEVIEPRGFAHRWKFIKRP